MSHCLGFSEYCDCMDDLVGSKKQAVNLHQNASETVGKLSLAEGI